MIDNRKEIGLSEATEERQKNTYSNEEDKEYNIRSRLVYRNK